MLDRILQFIKEAGAYKESDTDRDGLLSHSGETHGLVVGLYYGFVDFRDWGGLPEDYAKGKNIERGWYPKAGYIIGAIVRVGLYLALGGALMSLL
jgi:hypothetical protein